MKINFSTKKSLRTRSKAASAQTAYHLMLLPAVIILLIYNYIPLLGLVMSFQKYEPAFGFLKSKWVGLDNFIYIFSMNTFPKVMFNTLYIAIAKIVLQIVVCVLFALLLNEVSNNTLKRTIQTAIYFPHFLSWVLLSGIIIDLLSPSSGMLNGLIEAMGGTPIFFLADNEWFPHVIIWTDLWKEFGWGTIIYLASITSIDPALYEAANIDGAGRIRQTLHITIPGIMPMIVLTTILSLGRILNAGFDQVYNLYSPIVYESGDILDTLIYRIGLQEAQYSVGTAIGLFKSIISLILVLTSYRISDKLLGYRVI